MRVRLLKLAVIASVTSVAMLFPVRDGHAIRCPGEEVPVHMELVKIGHVTDADGVVLLAEDARWAANIAATQFPGDDGRSSLELEDAYEGSTVTAAELGE